VSVAFGIGITVISRLYYVVKKSRDQHFCPKILPSSSPYLIHRGFERGNRWMFSGSRSVSK